MADVVNLRLARKAKARAEAQDKAAQNRVRHGLSKAERTRQKADAARAAAQLGGARREGTD
ncbi:DUF4169 family protein [Novosphingobium aquiterrae]|uniref:DUF4169 family protein n=1 Tax=Novosphingobium aquiterrae TaxID=624388 RepID=A0ABV6PE24_9SPHN